MMILGLVLLSLVLSMAANCVVAWTLHTLWGWFAAASLGAGPSIGAWWCIAMIVHILVTQSTLNLQKSEQKTGDTWGNPIGTIIGCLVTLGIAWCFGGLLGWRA